MVNTVMCGSHEKQLAREEGQSARSRVLEGHGKEGQALSWLLAVFGGRSV